MADFENSGIVKVGMADFNIVKDPGMITTLGLGSCIAVVLFDRVKRIAGMAHVMLPDSNAIRNNSNRAKFADTAIADLLAMMENEGCKKQNLVAKMAGGAQMFDFDNADEIFTVGKKNAEATQEMLIKLGIPLLSQDTGKNYGRTVEFYTKDERFLIKSIGREEYFI